MKKSLIMAGMVLFLVAGCAGPPAGITPVADFDLNRYMGTWYEIARLDHRFERGLSRVSATYSPEEGGRVEVLNRGFDRSTGKWKEIRGRASLLTDSGAASLKVSFFPLIYSGYHVIELDQNRYSHALVCGPSRSYLWILARERRLDPNTLNRLILTANSLGFPTDKLVMVDQEGGASTDTGGADR